MPTKNEGDYMSRLATEKCVACGIRMVIRGDTLFTRRKCCEDCQDGIFSYKQQRYEQTKAINPCSHCSLFNKCADQLQMGYLD